MYTTDGDDICHDRVSALKIKMAVFIFNIAVIYKRKEVDCLCVCVCVLVWALRCINTAGISPSAP